MSNSRMKGGNHKIERRWDALCIVIGFAILFIGLMFLAVGSSFESTASSIGRSMMVYAARTIFGIVLVVVGAVMFVSKMNKRFLQ